MTDQTEKINGLTLRVEIEKLDGGYISNVINKKRRIFKNALDIDDAIDLKTILGSVEDDEYMLNIDLIPKDRYQEFLDSYNVGATQALEDELSLLEQAKIDGVIQPADTFDPHIIKKKEDLHVIAIDAKTAYPAARLKQINWKSYDEQLPLSTQEKAIIMGVKNGNMYQLWRTAVAGKALYHTAANRIGFTTLAKYYESNLGFRTNQKDSVDKLVTELLAHVREIELLAAKAAWTKSSALGTIVGKMRGLLIK